MEEPVPYACCFCGATIASGGLDVSYLLLITRWDGPTDRQGNQSLWCHFDCLKTRLHESVPLYLEYLEPLESE